MDKIRQERNIKDFEVALGVSRTGLLFGTERRSQASVTVMTGLASLTLQFVLKRLHLHSTFLLQHLIPLEKYSFNLSQKKYGLVQTLDCFRHVPEA